ncbi:MAG: ATP-binding protein, partial [Burkholderiales bacterium]
TIQTEAMELRSNYLSNKMPRTVAVIKNKIAQDLDRVAIYLLVDKERNVLASNIGELPLELFLPKDFPPSQQLNTIPGGEAGDWFNYTFASHADMDGKRKIIKGIGYRLLLPKGVTIIVGNHLRYQEKVQQIVLRVISLSSVLATLFAIGIGLLMNRMLMRRMEAINKTARSIMQGQLSERVAVGESGDEFDHLADNLNAMLNRIEELVSGIKQVSDNIAHDLRTPLSNIKHRIEHLLNSNFQEKIIREELRTILNRIDKLVSTFNAILQIAQIEAGGTTKSFKKFDFAEVIKSIVDFYEPLAEQKEQWLITDIDENINYYGDLHLISQAAANLLDNAIKYTPTSGSITIVLKCNEEGLILTVADSGPGIPAEYYDKVIERFFRMEHSRTSKGSGLGLSLVKAITNLHQGKLQFADNAPGLLVSLIFPFLSSTSQTP